MAYVANPTDTTRPTDTDDASGGAAELRALKAYLQTLIGGGTPINGYSWQGSRNRFVNGNFNLWQRGSLFASTSGIRCIADMVVNNSVGSTYVPSRQAFALGQTAVPYEPKYFKRTVVTSVAGAGNFCNEYYRVEGVRTFAGQQCTVSFWAKADANKNIAIEVAQYFGTGGSPSATVLVAPVTRLLSNAFQFITATFTMPSIAGKTIGSNNDDFIQCALWYDAGSTFNARTNTLGQQSGTFDISELQWEIGSTATPFELLNPAEELANCQRYYCKTYELDTPPTTVTLVGNISKVAYGTVGSSYIDNWDFPQTMRTPPSVTYINGSTGAGGTWRDGVNSDRGINSLTNSASRLAYAVSIGTTGAALNGHITADATYLVSV